MLYKSIFAAAAAAAGGMRKTRVSVGSDLNHRLNHKQLNPDHCITIVF